ncbi:MAG: N-acetyltransferase [Mesorhizobium sp.]|nr:MAG: N-acetyltransferase [Mesorhizobium sp.]RWH00863.1 MAG: N-acetyltransferase [Mesorhizobium sp.]TIN47613.1 MAG: GNAT family N-acetyltransferase [Mesorhizobium sp.]TIR92679.1 MAG: GNAT family N-acetyltransferase [Mesorhizobium sp.]TIS04250.1 MAG: GNAT family N-acetyltransferase [Mesorhizobium sp.]
MTIGQADFGKCKAIGVLDDEDRLVAGMVFHDWQPGPGLIQISSASTTARWLTAEVRHIMFSYPFVQLGCQMVVLQVSAKNARMVRIAKAFGFTPYLIKRMRGRDEDGYVFTLTDDDWRNSKFTRKIHGQTLSS